MPKVSVIVPIYNVEKYLAKCIDSLICQKFSNIEIILINDGSKDRSGEIAKYYAENYANIFAFDKENGGLSDARNYGIEKSSGEYLAFVDSDDYVDCEMFGEMFGLAQKHNAEMVICNIQKIDEFGKITQKLTQLANFEEKIDLKSNFSVFSDISYFACNKLFHKKLFNNIQFKKGIHFEDIDLIPKLLLKCNTIAKCDTYFYNYLERNDSITKTHTEKGLDILKSVKSVEEAFATSQFSNYINELKSFQILEGYYTFLAYLAFVKDDSLFSKMNLALLNFLKERKISKWEIINYKRFGNNYLFNLPLKKQMFYTLHLLGFYSLLKKLSQR